MKQRFRELIQTQRWLKYVPNSLTLCNSLCGFAAILYMLRAYERDLTSTVRKLTGQLPVTRNEPQSHRRTTGQRKRSKSDP